MGAMFNMKSSLPKVDGRLAASAKSVQLSVLLGGLGSVSGRRGDPLTVRGVGIRIYPSSPELSEVAARARQIEKKQLISQPEVASSTTRRSVTDGHSGTQLEVNSCRGLCESFYLPTATIASAYQANVGPS